MDIEFDEAKLTELATIIGGAARTIVITDATDGKGEAVIRNAFKAVGTTNVSALDVRAVANDLKFRLFVTVLAVYNQVFCI